jgi:hypothetical protein
MGEGNFQPCEQYANEAIGRFRSSLTKTPQSFMKWQLSKDPVLGIHFALSGPKNIKHRGMYRSTNIALKKFSLRSSHPNLGSEQPAAMLAKSLAFVAPKSTTESKSMRDSSAEYSFVLMFSIAGSFQTF